MTDPMHTDLLRHLPATHAAPSDHDRAALRALRARRRAMFRQRVAALAALLPQRPAAPRRGRAMPAE